MPDRRRALCVGYTLGETDSRARNLRAALAFLSLEPRAPELQLLHRWLDCWRGVGDVVTGMKRPIAEHRRCGDLDTGERDDRVWITCSCGARMERPTSVDGAS